MISLSLRHWYFDKSYGSVFECARVCLVVLNCTLVCDFENTFSLFFWNGAVKFHYYIGTLSNQEKKSSYRRGGHY